MDLLALNLTTDAARRFLDWLKAQDDNELQALLRHPAYQAVVHHSRTLSFAPLQPEDFLQAAKGLPSSLYGMRNVGQNTCDIERLAAYVERNRGRLVRLVAGSLTRLFDPIYCQGIGMHCVIGYDVGIGIKGHVAINLNSRKYLADNREIDFMLIHEAAHVVYERLHGPMFVEWIYRRGGLRRLVYTMIHNEGLAVYAAYAAREQAGYLDERDYAPLNDPGALQTKTEQLLHIIELLENNPTETVLDEVLQTMSNERLAYTVGCHLFQLWEQQAGLDGVKQAIRLPATEFVPESMSLLRASV